MKKIFIILTAAFFSSCNKDKEITLISQDIKELVFASGQLEWNDSYNLTAQTDGVLQNANFEIGNNVTRGKILAIIDNKTNQINSQTAQEQLVISNENTTDNSPQIQQLKQNIQFAENKYNQDKLQVERYKKLYETQSIAKIELENIQLNASNSLSNLNALKKQILQIRQQAKQQQINAKGQVLNNQVIKNYNSIVVTESGTIIKKLKNNGDYVRKGEIIATIANAQKVEAVLNVDENSIGKVKLGQTVFIQLNTNKNETFNGKITEILAAFDEKHNPLFVK